MAAAVHYGGQQGHSFLLPHSVRRALQSRQQLKHPVQDAQQAAESLGSFSCDLSGRIHNFWVAF